MFKFFRSKQKEPEKIEDQFELLFANEPKRIELTNAVEAKKIADEKLPEIQKREAEKKEENILFCLEVINHRIINCANEAQKKCDIYCENPFDPIDFGVRFYFDEIEKELIKKGYTVEAIKTNNVLKYIVIKW